MQLATRLRAHTALTNVILIVVSSVNPFSSTFFIESVSTGVFKFATDQDISKKRTAYIAMRCVNDDNFEYSIMENIGNVDC